MPRREVRETLKARPPKKDKPKSSNGEKPMGSRVRRFQKRSQLSALKICRNQLNFAGGVKQMPAMDTTAKVDKFTASNRQRCEKYVNKVQRQVHKVVEAGIRMH